MSDGKVYVVTRRSPADGKDRPVKVALTKEAAQRWINDNIKSGESYSVVPTEAL